MAEQFCTVVLFFLWFFYCYTYISKNSHTTALIRTNTRIYSYENKIWMSAQKYLYFPKKYVDLSILLIFTQLWTSFSDCICDKKYYYTLVWSDQLPKFLSKFTKTISTLEFGQIWDKVPTGGSPNYKHTKTYQKKSKFKGKYYSLVLGGGKPVGFKCNTNRQQVCKKRGIPVKCDTNTIHMWYKYTKVCKKEGEPVKNLSNMFLRLAQYPQIKSSIYKLLGVRYQEEAGKYAKKEKIKNIVSLPVSLPVYWKCCNCGRFSSTDTLISLKALRWKWRMMIS